MKVGIFCVFLLAFLNVQLVAQTSVMTYNIRYDNPKDNENWWGHRKEEVVDLIRYYSPTIFGIQEGLHHQVAYLDSSLNEYKYVGVGRDDGKTKGEYSAIFYRPEALKLLESQTYWLSETPDKVSVGWDASMERITTFAVFVDVKTGDTLNVFNAHFDHIGAEARLNSAKVILEIIEHKSLDNKQLIVMGDFNALPENAPIQTFKKKLTDPYLLEEVVTYGPIGTSNGFDPDRIMDRRIDYVLTKNINVRSYRHIDDRRKNNLYPSDHLPVLVELRK